MKKKTVTKTLVLNKKTIVHLDKPEMTMIHGGELATTPPTYCLCTNGLCRTSHTENTSDTC